MEGMNLNNQDVINHNEFSERVSDQITTIVQHLADQKSFIEALSAAIQANTLETAMSLLKQNREFVTSDFIKSPTGEMLANYLLESATDLLLQRYPFLHLLNQEENGKRIFYIGDWYKADTRHIVYLNVNKNDNLYYSIDLVINPEVLAQWHEMDSFKDKLHEAIEEKHKEVIAANKEYDKVYATELIQRKKHIETMRQEKEQLMGKMLKKQSDLDELEEKINKEIRMVERIEDEPDDYFTDYADTLNKLEDELKAMKDRQEQLHLVEALVKREKNEITQYLHHSGAFVEQIDELAKTFGTKKEA